MPTPRRFRCRVSIVAATLCAGVAHGQTGVQVNTDPITGANIFGDAANEPTLAVSPLDPDVMVIGWRQFPTVNSNSRFAGFAYSSDGGATWTNGGTLDAPPNQPTGAEQTDPVLTVDSSGIFYYWSEVFRPNPPTTHYVYRSLDGGMSWLTPSQVQDPPTSGDKEWMVADRSGGLGDGHIYGGWASFAQNGHVFVRSVDGGATFSEPLRIADQGGRQFMLHFAVGPDGELYAAWRHYGSNSVYVTKSINADDPARPPTFDALGAGGVNGLDVLVAFGNDPGGLAINPIGFHQVWLGVDRSATERRGHVYCLWADRRNDPSDIYSARSTDGGLTWALNRVNDDELASGASQWMVAMDVAPGGRIDAVWYDTRDDPSNALSAVYYSFSVDGGLTWSRNRRLSDAFDSLLGFPQQSKIGDYTQIVSQDDAVNIACATTFNGEQDVWFLRTVPVGLPGDLNCDAVVDALDIEPFLLALFEPANYELQYPDCELRAGDVNLDGVVDAFDIEPFLDLLFGP